MWSLGVVVDTPVFDDLSGFGEVTEDMLIQTPISLTAVEAFHEHVLHWLAGRDVVPADTRILATSENSVRCHLRSIVADNHIGFAATSDQLVQFTSNPRSGQ